VRQASALIDSLPQIGSMRVARQHRCIDGANTAPIDSADCAPSCGYVLVFALVLVLVLVFVGNYFTFLLRYHLRWNMETVA
jgi:hypothetical protein